MALEMFNRNEYDECRCVPEMDSICTHDVRSIVKALDRLTYMTAMVGCAVAHAAVNEPKAVQDTISGIRTLLTHL